MSYLTFSLLMPNRIVRFGGRDPPCMKQELKTAIRRKHRVHAKLVKKAGKRKNGPISKILKIKQPG